MADVSGAAGAALHRGVVPRAEREAPRKRKTCWGQTEVPERIQEAEPDCIIHRRALHTPLSRGLLQGYIIIHQHLGSLGRIITALCILEVREHKNSIEML